MKRLISVATISLALAVSMPSAKAAWWSSPDCNKSQFTTKELTNRSKPGVVMILTDKSTGSGFVVRHVKGKTLILTNSHVITDATEVLVQWPDGNQDSATIVLDGGAATTLTDLALLSVQGKEGVVLPLKKDEAVVGGDVIAIGAPRGLGFTLTKGIVSSLREEGRIVQTDTAINPGSSGGPLINEAGCVVGVNTLGMTDDVGLNFAISSQTARRFLDKYDPKNLKKSFKPMKSSEIRNKKTITKQPETSITTSSFDTRCMTSSRPLRNSEARRLWKDLTGKSYIDYKTLFPNINSQAEALTMIKLLCGFEEMYSPSRSSRTPGEGFVHSYNIDDIVDMRIKAKLLLNDYAGAIDDYTKKIQNRYEIGYISSDYEGRGLLKIRIGDTTDGCFDLREGLSRIQSELEEYATEEEISIDRNLRDNIRKYCS